MAGVKRVQVSDIDRFVGSCGTTHCMSDLLRRAAGLARATWTDIPSCPGIYAVYLPDTALLSFTTHAGRAKHAVPAALGRLCAKRDSIAAAGPTDILYIGKAGGQRRALRERIAELVRFGVGKARNHKGGEWLWQVERIAEARILTLCCTRGEAERIECELLAQFRRDHGEWPIANRNGGTMPLEAAGSLDGRRRRA